MKLEVLVLIAIALIAFVAFSGCTDTGGTPTPEPGEVDSDTIPMPENTEAGGDVPPELPI